MRIPKPCTSTFYTYLKNEFRHLNNHAPIWKMADFAPAKRALHTPLGLLLPQPTKNLVCHWLRNIRLTRLCRQPCWWTLTTCVGLSDGEPPPDISKYQWNPTNLCRGGGEPPILTYLQCTFMMSPMTVHSRQWYSCTSDMEASATRRQHGQQQAGWIVNCDLAVGQWIVSSTKAVSSSAQYQRQTWVVRTSAVR